MKISVLASSDIEAIKPLWELLNEAHHKNSQNWKKHFANFTFEERIKTIQKSDKYCIYISTINDEISGYCIASIKSDIGEIDSIFVKEKYRKSTIGQNLIKSSIKWLESHEVQTIKVGIAEGNESVFPFYEKLGFCKSMTILKKV